MSGITVTVDEIEEVLNAINNLLAPEPPDPSRQNIHNYVMAIVRTVDTRGDGHGVYDAHYQLSYLNALSFLLERSGKTEDDAFSQAKRILQAGFADSWGNADFPDYPVVADVRVKDRKGAFARNGHDFIDIRDYARSANPDQKQILADWMWSTDQGLVAALTAIKTAAETLKEKLAVTDKSGTKPRPF